MTSIEAKLEGLSVDAGDKSNDAVEHSKIEAEASTPVSTSTKKYGRGENPKLRYKKPYWWPYRTFVKQRWIGRELLEVISTEFRDRSVEYYKHALESGVTRVNGVTAWPGLILRDGDRLDNTVHRHEPPITNNPILILHIDREKQFIVISKPGSMPVHATGRYFRHTVLEVMESDYGIKCYAVNRLDRLTSGLMIMALTGPASRDLATEFAEGTVKKQYVARVKGRFPDGEIVVDQPLISVDRQMGLVIVAPEGKPAKTIFKGMSYDEERDQSVVHCRPQTGRTHQLRVHLQWLGYPIANDPLYSLENVWGSGLGQGGVELADQTADQSQAAMIAKRLATPQSEGSRTSTSTPQTWANGQEKVMNVDSVTERDMANIDVSSPIRLSQQAKDIICRLRKMKDEAEDWVKWNEVVFATKEAQDSLETPSTSASASAITPPTNPPANADVPHSRAVQAERKKEGRHYLPEPLPDSTVSPLRAPVHIPEGFCHQCFVPLAEDPDPETLFIYLHAWKYETNGLGAWETPLPRWASEDWDGDWRGWANGEIVKPAIERVGYGDAPAGTKEAVGIEA